MKQLTILIVKMRARTIMDWHLTFKVNGECFVNRYFHEKNGYARVLPPLLQTYPEAKEMMVGYMKTNLNHLSTEMLSSYMHETLLPLLAKKREKEMKATFELGQDEKLKVEDFLKQNGLTKLAIPTVYRWIRRLGFKYEVRKKCYYIDTHEKKLDEKGLPTNGQKRHLQERCITHSIPTEEQRNKIIEGWLHRPKGMVQILWERGFLTEVETSMMRIRLVGRRMEAGFSLKVPVYLHSCRCNQILSMRLPFFNISPNSVQCRLVVN
jgi:hypothetical protein